MSLRAFTLFNFCLVLSLVLAGCGGTYSAPSVSAPAAGVKLSGSVHGGQQPIIGAHVYLYAANTTGYGQPSISLLDPTATRLSDSIGAYVTTDDQGAFTITNDYSCTPNTQVYIYALGGNPGAGVNSGAGLLAAFLAAFLFVAPGLTHWLWDGTERRPRLLRAGRLERPG